MNFSLHYDYLHFFNLQFISLSLIIFIFSLVDLHSIQFLKMKKMLDLIIFIPSIVDMISKNRYVMVKELIMNVDVNVLAQAFNRCRICRYTSPAKKFFSRMVTIIRACNNSLRRVRVHRSAYNMHFARRTSRSAYR